jgi:hypothetical protein
MTNTVNDAVRMVGQLLLHNSTTGAHARDSFYFVVPLTDPEACKFCYIGAVHSVRRSLPPVDAFSLRRACEKALNLPMFEADVSWWDDATDEQRKTWAQKMADWSAP